MYIRCKYGRVCVRTYVPLYFPQMVKILLIERTILPSTEKEFTDDQNKICTLKMTWKKEIKEKLKKKQKTKLKNDKKKEKKGYD